MLEKTVEKHIKIEKEMIDFIEEILKDKKLDRGLAYGLKYILSDEYRHHRLLRGLLEVIIKRGSSDRGIMIEYDLERRTLLWHPRRITYKT